MRRMLRQKEDANVINKEDLTRETKDDSVGVEVEKTLGEEDEAP